jgi:1-acyl-sn-glycerol-3-phosphate acyltransferase
MPPGAERTYPTWVAAFARFLLRIFFGRVDVVGEVMVPLARPLLYVANHNNSLVDPLLVLGFLPGRPRFLAKATLWRNPVLRPFLALGRVIPVYRRQDEGFDAARNDETFARSREVLAAGGAIALFPEGRSHSDPALAELKTGAARILLGLPPAVRASVAVVPVGLHFDAPGRFRSRVLVQVGEPFGIAEQPPPPGAVPALAVAEASPEAVRRLTERVATALAGVTLSFSSWDEARLLGHAADLWLQPDPELPVQPPLPARFAARQRVLAAYRDLGGAQAPRLQRLADAIGAYDRLLAAFGLRDEQVAAAYPLPSVASFLARSLWVVLVRVPLAAIGVVLGFVPWQLCTLLASRLAKQPDQPATYKLFGGILLYPLCWAAEAALAWQWWGWRGALAVAALGPIGGWAAVRSRDRLRLLVTEARAYVLLRGPIAGRLGRELRRRRQVALGELRELADGLGVGEPPR